MHLLLLLSGCLLGCTGVLGQHHQMNKEEKKVLLGGEVVLPCKVYKPSESATVHWLYVIPEGENVQKILTAGPKGTIIEDSDLKSRVSLKNNSRLVIENLQVPDNKQFICRVEFSNGVTKESRIQLSVFKTPSVPELKLEQNGIPVTEEAVQIGTCESKNGFPMPVIKWYKDDTPLRDKEKDVKIHIQRETGSTGLITVKSTLSAPVQKSDANAFFHCDVSYSLPAGDHMQESERKQITVHYPTTTIKVYFKSPAEVIKEGDKVELICEGDGNPQPAYTLHKKDNESPLAEDLSYSWTVSREDSGTYMCKSLMLDGEVLELEEFTELHVHYVDPPVLSLESPVTVDLHSKLMVSCQASNASTQTVIHWKQDHKTIAEGPLLNLDVVDYSAAGLYTCEVGLLDVPNLTKSKDINIIVQGGPQVSVTSPVIEVLDGDTVTTNCTATGYPQPQIMWYINDTEVNAKVIIYSIKDYEVTSELTLSVNKDFINQSLTCMALNDLNKSTTYIQLLQKSLTTTATTTTAFSVTSLGPLSTRTIPKGGGTEEPIVTRDPETEPRHGKSYGIVIVIVIVCILLLAFLGAVLYFLYKKGHIPCGRSGKKDITNPGAKDKIIVEMKPDSPAEESVLLTGSQEKKPSDQEKYIDLRN